MDAFISQSDINLIKKIIDNGQDVYVIDNKYKPMSEHNVKIKPYWDSK